jgi:hypothetical protein
MPAAKRNEIKKHFRVNRDRDFLSATNFIQAANGVVVLLKMTSGRKFVI